MPLEEQNRQLKEEIEKYAQEIQLLRQSKDDLHQQLVTMSATHELYKKDSMKVSKLQDAIKQHLQYEVELKQKINRQEKEIRCLKENQGTTSQPMQSQENEEYIRMLKQELKEQAQDLKIAKTQRAIMAYSMEDRQSTLIEVKEKLSKALKKIDDAALTKDQQERKYNELMVSYSKAAEQMKSIEKIRFHTDKTARKNWEQDAEDFCSQLNVRQSKKAKRNNHLVTNEKLEEILTDATSEIKYKISEKNIMQKSKRQELKLICENGKWTVQDLKTSKTDYPVNETQKERSRNVFREEVELSIDPFSKFKVV